MSEFGSKKESIFRFITFHLADTLLGINILDIREIVPANRVTEVQHAPKEVMGLMNLRGRILTVLDVCSMLSLNGSGRRAGSHIIVFKHHPVGFMVDDIGDMMAIDPELIESIPANIDMHLKSYLDGMVHMDSNLIMMVNAGKILEYIPVLEEI